MTLIKETSQQCNFSIVEASLTGTYGFKMGFCGLGHMPNEFQRVMDSGLEHLPGMHVHLGDILILTRESEERHWREIRIVLNVLAIIILRSNGVGIHSS